MRPPTEAASKSRFPNLALSHVQAYGRLWYHRLVHGVIQTITQTFQVLFGGRDCHVEHIAAADDVELADASRINLVISLSCIRSHYL